MKKKSYWLLKSEPDVWSIDQQKKEGKKGAIWDGVRNYQASNNLKKMRKGDYCFFYHSNIGKEIVGIVEVINEAFIDPTDKKGRFVAVRVKFKNMLNAVEDHDWSRMAVEMEDSRWFKQVGRRSIELQEIVRSQNG